MNVSRSELHALRSERWAYAQAVLEIREATGLHDVPLDQLPGMVEQLLSELADRQIRHDIEPAEFAQAPEPEIQWAPEDVVVPRPSCRGCLRLVELDGRLTCGDERSSWCGATLVWPGPGCMWSSDPARRYGGGR